MPSVWSLQSGGFGAASVHVGGEAEPAESHAGGSVATPAASERTPSALRPACTTPGRVPPDLPARQPARVVGGLGTETAPRAKLARALMALLRPEHALDVVVDPALGAFEASDDVFDRTAFAMEALDLLRPCFTAVAVFEGRRLHVASGRAWGMGAGARWAMIAVPPNASRRAIASAVAALTEAPRPYAMAVLEAQLEP